jgi:hypothetical protein
MTALFLFLPFIEKSLFSEEYGEKDRQNNAYDNARRDGKIKTESFLFDIYIPRQSAEERYLVGKQKCEPCEDQNNSRNDKHLTHCRH